MNRGGMEGEDSTTSGSWLNYRLTATPSAAGTKLPTTCPVTTCLLELYQECVEKGVWSCVLYEVHDGMEKLTFLSKNDASFTPARTTTSQREETCMQQEAQGGMGREEAYPLSGPPPPVWQCGRRGNSSSGYDHYSGLRHCRSGSSRGCFSPPASSMPTPHDPPRKRVKTVMDHSNQQQILCCH